MTAILGTVSAVLSISEQSLKLFDLIRNSLKSNKANYDVYNRHRNEISSIRQLVELINEEDSLRTPAVSNAVEEVKGCGERLNTFLESVKNRSESTRIEQFGHAMITGSGDETELQRIMQDLGRAKSNLTNSILLCNIGLVRDVNNSVKVNTSVLERLDALIKARLGMNYTLRMKKLIEGRRAMGDGCVSLTIEELSSLAIDVPDSITSDETDAKDKTSKRVITYNRTLGKSFMVNTPVAESDIWKDIDELIIRGNTCEDDSTMFNYPVPTNVLLEAMRIRTNVAATPKGSG